MFSCSSHSGGRKGNKSVNILTNKLTSESGKCCKRYMSKIQENVVEVIGVGGGSNSG